MKLSDFLKILHNYIGIDCHNQDYIPYICTLIMREPKTPEEIQENEDDHYYPYSGKAEEKDFLGRIYNGRSFLPKAKARMIRKRYNTDQFASELKMLENKAQSDMASELGEYKVNCTAENLSHICVELMDLFVEASVLGIPEVDGSKVGDNQELTIPPYDDSELKNKYGAYLLGETHQRCPYDGCFKFLGQYTEDRSAFDYNIVPINPKLELDNVDNLIALCPECARKYMFFLNADSMDRLVDLKLELSNLMNADEILSEQKIVDGVNRVIKRIASIPLDKDTKLNYEPSQIKKKMERQNSALYIKIYFYASKYYPDVEGIFKDLSREGNMNYDKFCRQMRVQYQNLTEKGLSQTEIFDLLTNWLCGTTNEEKTCCEVLVSYFVQKCEVFDVITE